MESASGEQTTGLPILLEEQVRTGNIEPNE